MTRALTKKRSNLRDVAARAGVSVATVSRVLNSPDKVATETRNRVEAAITQLRFIPSAAARAMNRGRSGTVAALLPTLDHSIYARVVNGLETRLAEKGLSLIVAQTGDDLQMELRRAREMVDIGAEALIVAGVTHDAGLYALMEQAQIPVVAISYFDRYARLPTVGYDNAAAARLAAAHLGELGHREIAVLHGPVATNDRMRQRKATLEMGDFDLVFRFLEVPISVEGGHAGVSELLYWQDRPTALLCFSDVIAHGAMARLQAEGWSIPGDVSVIGMEDLEGSRFTHPALTSVALSVERMGVETAEAVSSWLETDEAPEPVELATALVRRASTGQAPG